MLAHSSAVGETRDLSPRVCPDLPWEDVVHGPIYV